MSVPRRFIVTAHAQQRGAERGISRAQFIKAITKADNKKRQRRGDRGGIVYLFSKRIGDKELRIAAEISNSDCFFITGYWV